MTINLRMAKTVITISPMRLGDTIFCTPVFRLLKTVRPDLQIDIIAQTPLAAEALKYNPYIRELFVQPSLEQVAALADHYDLGFAIHKETRTSPYEVFFKDKWLSYPEPQKTGLHVTEYLLNFYTEQLGESLDNFNPHYDLFPQAEHHARIQHLLTDDEGVFIGYHMGCHGLAKKRTRLWNPYQHKKAWPLNSFIALSKQLKRYNPSIRIVLTGSKAEEALGKLFCKKIPDTINLINQTSILDLAALMSRLQLFLSNDTGALHVACANQNLPVIGLFGGSDPVLTGPFPRNEKRSIFFNANISKIPVASIFQAICEELNKQR
ncbi:MAG: hypothetical protein A2X77_04250 [Gammaproteobacteria bacterium GWE2_42_36]|nr:MAG: hypothetical protein A2X77_04250 [Gammaproteobacteria bacterium GWE2_42_36]HCU05331.1 hypothetical protein [Coxiellaceae bacterium]